MKKLLKLAVLVVLLVAVVFFVTKGPTGLSGANDKEIGRFSLQYSGDDAAYSLSLLREGENERVRLEAPFVPGGSVSFTASADVFASLQDVVKRNNLDSWDGFHEANDGILDGSGFSLVIEYTDGTSVRASGSNVFPSGYQQGMKEITEAISENIFGLTGLGNIKLPF